MDNAEHSKTIVIYGCGELGKLASEFFKYFGIENTPVDVEPKNYKDDKFWEDKKIYKLDDISKKDNPLIVVCISTYSYNSIRDNLKEQGHDNVVSFFEFAEKINKEGGYVHPLRNGWKVSDNSEAYKEKTNLVKSKFIDKLSKEHYSQFYHWHSFYDERIKDEYSINCNDRYFIPEILNAIAKGDVFVDVGAYDGRVSLKFKEHVNGEFDSIHCFEPDDHNYDLLENNIKKNDTIYKYKVALGDKNEKLGFNFDYGYMSNMNSKSDKKTIVKTLDSFGSIKPSYIKYHLEGYELEAIRGSLNTIERYRPIIAATTYHSEAGLHVLPLYLFNHLKDYVFMWRNHNYLGQGAVIYCIPKERWKSENK